MVRLVLRVFPMITLANQLAPMVRLVLRKFLVETFGCPHGQVNTYKFSNGYAMSGQTCTSNMARFASPIVRLVVAALGCPYGQAST